MTGAAPRASVVIRARDEARLIARTLALLDRQVIDPPGLEVIVVDSGSTDATVALARAAGARVVEVGAESFSFGGALNRGCAEARGELLVALSAHALPPDEGWLARLLSPFEDARVACASGARYGPGGERFRGRVVQDAALAGRHPHWGYSNGEGAFRAALWRERPFREDMPGAEDKEWAWHWLQRGRLCVLAEDFATIHDHSGDSPRLSFVRARREWTGYRMFLPAGPYGVRELAAEWWREREGHRSAARARLSPRRLARLAGKYAAGRR
jgi:glycosyltransferase involved in cell wall biosynthesis